MESVPDSEGNMTRTKTKNIKFAFSTLAHDRRWIFNLKEAIKYANEHPDAEVIYVHKLADEFACYDVRELEYYAHDTIADTGTP